MQKSLVRILCAAAAGVLLAGCGPNPNKLSSADKAAFNSATPEIKQTWERGLTASKASDYLTAQTNLYSLLSQPTITPDQTVAVQTALRELGQRIMDAAAKGDAAAQKALDAIKASAPGRRR